MEKQLSCGFFSDFIEKNNILKMYPVTNQPIGGLYEFVRFGNPNENTAVISFENLEVNLYAEKSRFRKKVSMFILVRCGDEVKHTILKVHEKQREVVTELDKLPSLKEHLMQAYDKMEELSKEKQM